MDHDKHFQHLLLFFYQKKTVVEASNCFTKPSLKLIPILPFIKTCEYWFRRFKSDDFDLEYKEHPGQLKKFEAEKL